jgi:O-antigen/teichoic acid export membrane protein
MMTHRWGKILSNSAWAGVHKYTYALVKLITVPLLLRAYGRESFGLIALAISLHAYMQILSMGLPTGVVKYVAEWLGKGEIDKLQGALRSTVLCYSCIGIINCAVLAVLAVFAGHIFNVQEEQISLLQTLIYIVAAVALVQWPTVVVEQALVGAQEIGWISKLRIIVVFLDAILVLYTCCVRLLPLSIFFLLSTLLVLVPVPFLYHRWRRYSPLFKSMFPGWKWQYFQPMFLYSIALFAFSFAQNSAMQLRPIIVGMRVVDAAGATADYRVLFGITQFVLMAVFLVLTPLLPAVSHAASVDDRDFIDKVMYLAPRYIWGIFALPLFGAIVCAPQLLSIYVGEEFSHLAVWLRIWLLALSTQLHIAPISAVILGTGKVKLLVKYTYVSCVVSIIGAWLLCPKYGVGGAAFSTLIYFSLQGIFFYTIFIPKILNGDARRIFLKTYMPPLFCGVVMGGITYASLSVLHISSPIIYCLAAAVIGVFIYGILAYFTLFDKKDAAMIIKLFGRGRNEVGQ